MITEDELFELPWNSAVLVTANDYSYEGWIVSVFEKRKSNAVRCVVEDSNGRLFIHNATQITVFEGEIR